MNQLADLDRSCSLGSLSSSLGFRLLSTLPFKLLDFYLLMIALSKVGLSLLLDKLEVLLSILHLQLVLLDELLSVF